MYLCDTCGYGSARAGQCPSCVAPLSVYTKETQAEYQVNLEQAMRSLSDKAWYI
jgi:predicted ATP-dependent serine protease